MNAVETNESLVTLWLLLPEAILALGICGVLLLDMVLARAQKTATTLLAVATCLAAGVAALLGEPGEVTSMLVVDGVTPIARCLVLAPTASVLLVAAGRNGPGAESDDRAAFAVCVLGVALGASFATVASNLLLLWLGLELISLSSYALAAWHGGDRRAAEAGMKFVLFGSLASALMLFGMSHVYGLTGHLDFVGIGNALQGLPAVTLTAVGLVGVGIAYKLTVVPFHFYAPDVYEGAPTLSVAAVGIAPKVGAAAALAHALQLALPASVASSSRVGDALAVVAGASMVVAAFTALVQRDAKRIVAFSSIGQAGTVLLALACLPDASALGAAMFQLLAYAIGNLGALVCLSVLESDRGSCSLDALRGVGKERPWVTGLLCLFLFSLAGLPPLAGFLGKWAVLGEALRFGLPEASRPGVALSAIVLLVATAVSAWSYLLIVRAAVLRPPPAEPVRRHRLSIGTRLVLGACAALVVLVGSWLDGTSEFAARLSTEATTGPSQNGPSQNGETAAAVLP